MLSISDLRRIATRSDSDRAGLPPSTFHGWRAKNSYTDLTTTQLVKLARAKGYHVVLVPIPEADRVAAKSPLSTPTSPLPAPHPCAAMAVEKLLVAQLAAVRAIIASPPGGCAAAAG